jgi:hypothetical protein
MRSKRDALLHQSTPVVVTRNETRTPHRSGPLRDDDTDPNAGTPTDSGHIGEVEEHARRRGREWGRGRAAAVPTRRRLGPLEYTLLALIALGIGITITMAIINPSA